MTRILGLCAALLAAALDRPAPVDWTPVADVAWRVDALTLHGMRLGEAAREMGR